MDKARRSALIQRLGFELGCVNPFLPVKEKGWEWWFARDNASALKGVHLDMAERVIELLERGEIPQLSHVAVNAFQQPSTEPRRESPVTVNGIELTSAQVLALRAALTSLHGDMGSDRALGDDELGRAMARGYRERASEVLALLGVVS
jgi:hypothetical protein